MSLQLTINLDFLEMIDPPVSFPPNQEDLYMQIQSKFVAECERFIANERTIYKCSKAIQSRLKNIQRNSENIQQKMSSQKDSLTSIAQELTKYKDQESKLKQRERLLKMLCGLVRMEDIRKELLIEQDKNRIDLMEMKPISINQEEYINRLEQLSITIQQSKQISYLGQQFVLIRQILTELENIFQSAIKFIIKRLMTPKMVSLILNNYYPIFFKEAEISKNPMNAAITTNRLQHMKICLNPMINNLNYATNIPQLYQSILTAWASLIKQEILLFKNCQRADIAWTVNQTLMSELLNKMEKNIFRIKDLISIVRIRKYFNDFRQAVVSIEEWVDKRQELHQLQNVLEKCQAVITARMAEEAQALEGAKYNIYSISSYIPIRQHLQKVKLAYEYSVTDEKMDWQVGFYNLCSSRDPKNYPNNKSLVIFNLNIWYLYLKIVTQGKHRVEGNEIMQWSLETLTNINVAQTNRRYYESFDKILQLCGNIQAFKATLYAQLTLLGHDDLRRQSASIIKNKYLDCYEKMLAKMEQRPMSNQQVKVFCHSKKINLNKFGKHSHSICIYSREALTDVLEYQ